MDSTEGNLLALFAGGAVVKKRVQHPEVHEREDRGSYYWFFRYRKDVIQADGTVKTTRPFHTCGPSRGPDKITITRAREIRDEVLAELNAAATKTLAVVAAKHPEIALAKAPDPGDIKFGLLAELWKRDYVEKVVAGKRLLALPTTVKYKAALGYILPRWQDTRLKEIKAKEVLDWLGEVCTSWYKMEELRNAMSGIVTKAIQWEIIPDTYANPIQRVKLPPKWEVREKRILSPEETAQVLALLEEPNLLICETCLDTGTRISEALGLQIKHVDLERGTIRIEQRNHRGDIDKPKTPKSRRMLALGALTERYKTWIAGLKRKGPNDWVFPQEEDLSQPRWDSGVRKALKNAAASIKQNPDGQNDPGLDFEGFGLHSLRRANITWRQEVGGSAIEASKIAGHTKVETTLDYTQVAIKRQDDLTRRIQEKRGKAARKVGARTSGPEGKPPASEILAAQRERARKAREARKAKTVEMVREEVA